LREFVKSINIEKSFVAGMTYCVVSSSDSFDEIVKKIYGHHVNVVLRTKLYLQEEEKERVIDGKETIEQARIVAIKKEAL
jgi:hypothetical protein